MNLRTLQARKESADESKWEAKWDQDAFDSALECEAEAIASRRLKDPAYLVKLINSADLEMDTIIDEGERIDWSAIVYMLLAEIMTPAQAKEKLAKWLMWRDDVMREARGNIEGDMYDNLYDADDQWSDA